MNTLAALLLCVATNAAPQQPARDAPPQLRQAFDLLDEFDTLDTSKLPFVRVATGRRSEWHDKPPQNTWRHGFLLGADRATFRVRYLELDSETLTITPPGTVEYARVGFEPIDLRTYAAALASRLEQHGNGTGEFFIDEPDSCTRDTPMHRTTVALLVARACSRSGFGSEAAALGTELFEGGHRLVNYELKADLAEYLALAHGDPDISWQALLERHEALLRSGYEDVTGRLTKQRDALVAVIAHRSKLRPRSEPPSDRDLLEELRDHPMPTGPIGWSGLTTVDATLPIPVHAQRAFDLLMQRGPDAAPALIAALGDTTPTRSVAYGSRFGGHFETRSLGSVANNMLAAVAGGVHFPWEEWLKEVTAQRRRPWLLHQIDRGNPCAVESWLRCWPDDVEPLLTAMPAAEPMARFAIANELLRGASAAARPKVLAMLRADGGVAARELLLAHGDRSGFQTLAAAWRNGSVTDQAVLPELESLLKAGIPDVWSHLQLRIADPAVRRALVASLACLYREDIVQHVPPDELASFGQSVRACLLPLLEDGTRIGPRTVALGRRRIDLHDASVADIAAFTLSSLWPGEFAFDAARSASSRARQVDALRHGGSHARLPGRDTQTRPDRVVEVRIAASASGLGAATLAALRGLRGKEIDAASLMEAIGAMASCPEAPGKRAVLHLERTGEGDGTRLCASLVAPAVEDSELECACTVAGTTIARVGTSPDHRAARAGMDAVISRALAAEPTASVEITIGILAK